MAQCAVNNGTEGQRAPSIQKKGAYKCCGQVGAKSTPGRPKGRATKAIKGWTGRLGAPKCGPNHRQAGPREANMNDKSVDRALREDLLRQGQPLGQPARPTNGFVGAVAIIENKTHGYASTRPERDRRFPGKRRRMHWANGCKLSAKTSMTTWM